MRKKICYLFIFPGFDDHSISLALQYDEYQLKTIAITKEPVRSRCGVTILPDADFLPEVDLVDIDPSNTGLLILPGANAGIMPLIDHCLLHGIQIISTTSNFVHRTSNLYAESYS